MKLVRTEKTTATAPTDIETVAMSGAHLDFLDRIGRRMNADMPSAFATPHVIRTLLDRIAASGVDLTDATSEDDVARLAARAFQRSPSRVRG